MLVYTWYIPGIYQENSISLESRWCTSTYQYIPVCTSMYLYLTKLVQFWNSTSSHCIPCIGDVYYCITLISSLLRLTLSGLVRKPLDFLKVRTCMYPVCTGTYRYVQTGNSCTGLYHLVLVRTGTYQYVPFCPIQTWSLDLLLMVICDRNAKQRTYR